ncbi:hypothetical protein P20439_1376 [Pseudoalteromonas sp. BSi20439]|nr:hypothetical protein P20439_1376 [Pseudoalteromonas sp. BSi20439]
MRFGGTTLDTRLIENINLSGKTIEEAFNNNKNFNAVL